MALAAHKHDPQPAPAVVSKAVVRAANELNIRQQLLADILGVSAATASRLVAGHYLIPVDTNSKTGEAAVLFLRLYRSLLSLFGGNTDNATRWLAARNRNFPEPPIMMITNLSGLFDVIGYLDAMRGHE